MHTHARAHVPWRQNRRASRESRQVAGRGRPSRQRYATVRCRDTTRPPSVIAAGGGCHGNKAATEKGAMKGRVGWQRNDNRLTISATHPLRRHQSITNLARVWSPGRWSSRRPVMVALAATAAAASAAEERRASRLGPRHPTLWRRQQARIHLVEPKGNAQMLLHRDRDLRVHRQDRRAPCAVSQSEMHFFFWGGGRTRARKQSCASNPECVPHTNTPYLEELNVVVKGEVRAGEPLQQQRVGAHAAHASAQQQVLDTGSKRVRHGHLHKAHAGGRVDGMDRKRGEEKKRGWRVRGESKLEQESGMVRRPVRTNAEIESPPSYLGESLESGPVNKAHPLTGPHAVVCKRVARVRGGERGRGECEWDQRRPASGKATPIPDKYHAMPPS